MKIFRSDQIKKIDEYTISNEPVSSIDLMERAASMIFKWLTDKFDRSCRIIIFAGPGNNGGDGIALARMLSADRYDAELHYVKFADKTSADWEANRLRLERETCLKVNYIEMADQFPVISASDIIIDAIFGSGLTRPVEGLAGDIIRKINEAVATIIAIDIPSGLFGEDNSKNSGGNIIEADFTLSFQFPKLSFMFSENSRFVGEWEALPIGLSRNAITNTKSPYSYLLKTDLSPLLRRRKKFDHKGNYGHGLLVSGSYGKMGATVLSAGAALRTGIGLITCHIPNCGATVLQSSLPEAMANIDISEKYISESAETDLFSAVGLGPGLSTMEETQKVINQFLTECKKPMVIDADALNIISLNREWLSSLPSGTILTPHPKEFERLAGMSDCGFSRLEMQINFSKRYKCILVLKGAHTSITTPDGRVLFNSTGNPGMATAGSGDVLTGIILSLLAQGYTPENAAVLGVYLHGLAGDIAAGKLCYESIIASDIINCISDAFNTIRESDL